MPPPSRSPNPSLPGARLLREAAGELLRLRRIRGAHRRTARRIARAQARLAVGALLFAAPLGAAAGTPKFFDPLEPYGISDVGSYGGAWPAFADVDGDGDLDAFVGDDDGHITFFLNAGTLSQAVFYAPWVDPFGVTGVGRDAAPSFADLDGDGDLDLVVASHEECFLFSNTGTPSAPAFAPPVASPLGLDGNAHPAFLDGDGDGDLDAIASFGDLRTILFENTGTPQAPAFLSPFEPFGLTRSSALVDIDDDGDLDSLAAPGREFEFSENTGSAQAPAFAAPITEPFGLTQDGYSGARFADVDGDGDFDLFSVYQDGDDVFVARFENTGAANAPAFGGAATFLVGQSQGVADLPSFGDIDGDGDLDVLLGFGPFFYGGFETRLYENTGTANAPAFAPGEADPFGLVGNDGDWQFVDPDGDGDLDILLGSHLLAENTGTTLAPAFAVPAPSSFGVEELGVGPVGDIDGDGDLDILSVLDELLLLENTGSASEPAFSSPLYPFGLVGGAGSGAPALGDLDGDGDLDAVGGWQQGSWSPRTGNMTVFENTGSSELPAFVSAGLVGDVFHGAPTLADLDSDGDLDLVLGLPYGRSLFVENVGSPDTPEFRSPLHPFGLDPTVSLGPPALVDLDGDGDLDYFAGDYPGSLLLFENTGNAIRPAFAPAASEPFGLVEQVPRWPQPIFGDLDGDGDLDLLLVEDPPGLLVYFENTGSSAAPAFAVPSTNPFGLSISVYGLRVVLADFDGDADLDLLTTGSDGTLQFSENTGTRTQPAFGAPVTDPFGLNAKYLFYPVPSVADAEGDGDLDVFIGAQGGIFFFENTGTRTAPSFYGFGQLHAFGIGGQDDGLPMATFGDLDGDGDLDALTGADDRTLFVENEELAPPCPPMPEQSCTGGFAKARLSIDERERKRGKEELRLELRKGPTLAQSAFGDPLAPGGTEYAICLYDDADQLAAALRLARAGESCGGAAPCWRALGDAPPDGKGYAYRDAAGAAHGLRSLRLEVGRGQASLAALSRNPKSGAGATARPRGAVAALEGASAVTVQLRTSDAGCFSAELADVRKSTSEVFKAR